MKRFFVSVTQLLLLILLLTGCVRKFKISADDLSDESPWPFVRGDKAALGAYPDASFSGKLDFIWERKERDKPAGPLTIYHDALVYPGTKKTIKFFDLKTGKKLGRIKSRGLAQSGVIMNDSMAFFAIGPHRNRLSGYNLIKNKRTWKHPVKDASIGPILVNNRLIISSGDGTVEAIDPETGENIWIFKADEKFLVSPSFYGDKLFQPGDGGHLFVLAVDDGTLIDKIEVDGPLLSHVAASEIVYFADVLGNAYSVDAESSEIIWKTRLDGPVWAAPALAEGVVIFGHSGGEVVALDTETGEQKWSFRTGEVVKAAPIIVGQFVIVATAGGKIYCLRVGDGTALAMQELKGGIKYPPLTDGRNIFVVTQKGHIACFGDGNEQVSKAGKRVNARDESQ